MNKDFMLLNDNTIEVINERGEEINRGKFKNNNAKGILLAENKMEMTETFKKAFDKELNENNKLLNMANNGLKIQVVLIFGLPLFGFIYGAISNPNLWIINGISESIYAFSGSIIPIIAASIYWSTIKAKYKKIKRRMEMMINKTEDMKKESAKELEEEYEKIVDYTLEPLVKNSLESETDNITLQITKELINFAEETLDKKGKTKIKRR